MHVVAPYISPRKVLINALFIQPTTTCALNCNGCYVKGFESNNTLGEDLNRYSTKWWYLFNLINRPEGYNENTREDLMLRCNQITLALDNLPGPESIEGSRMIEIARGFFALKTKFYWVGRSPRDDPEYHATTHSVDTFLSYLEHNEVQFMLQTLQDKKVLDVLSISSLKENDILKLKRTREYVNSINWNLTIYPLLNTDTIKNTFEKIATTVDSVYLVLHKPSTGRVLNSEAWDKHVDFVKFIKTLPIDIQKKVNIDGCVSDGRRFLDTGYGCSSNISRFQVWPDGSVSGCPYSQTRVTPSSNWNPHNDVYTDWPEGILQNIYQASRVYEFNKCKIPTAVDPEHKRVNPRNYLEIIE